MNEWPRRVIAVCRIANIYCFNFLCSFFHKCKLWKNEEREKKRERERENKGRKQKRDNKQKEGKKTKVNESLFSTNANMEKTRILKSATKQL